MIGVSRDDTSVIIGVSRQTYFEIETNKRKMTWNAFLSLILFFDQNEKTCDFLNHIGAFSEALKHISNVNQREKTDE